MSPISILDLVGQLKKNIVNQMDMDSLLNKMITG